MHNPRGCWRECIAATLALFCTTGMNVNAFAVCIPYLRDLLELSYTQSSNFIVVRSLFAFASLFAVKYYYEKLEVRLGFSLMLGLAALSSFLYSWAGSYAGICVAAAVSGLAYGLGGMYPAAILIHRWFPSHEGVAMGICAAGTGAAIIVGAPAMTALTQMWDVRLSLQCQGWFILVCGLICFMLIRNFPAGVLTHPAAKGARHKRLPIGKMYFAVLLVGVLGISGYSGLTMHCTTEGMEAFQVSTVVSIVGLALTAGKFFMGELLDLWGARKTNWLFFGAAVLGCILFGLGQKIGFAGAVVAAVLFGVGDSVATVGLTAYARDLSTPEDFAATQQQYQSAFMLGGLVSGALPGLLAELTGSYCWFYLGLAVLVVLATAVIQGAYLKKEK